MSGSVGGSRVPIPDNVRKMIQHIREITGKQHGDDEILAVLKDCGMDPNETAQKLLYLDTFHEVKGRRNRKKENATSQSFEEFSSKQGGLGRVARGFQGGYSYYSDAAGGRNVSARKQNGVSYLAERNVAYSSIPYTQKSKNAVTTPVTRTRNQLNVGSSHGVASHSAVVDVMSVAKDVSAIDISKNHEAKSQDSIAALSTPAQTFSSVIKADKAKPGEHSNQIPTTASVSGVYSSSNPVSSPSVSWNPSVGAIKRKVGNQRAAVGQELNTLAENDLSDVVSSQNGKATSGSAEGSTQKKKSGNDLKEIEKSQLPELEQPSTLSNHDVPLVTQSTISVLCSQPPVDKGTPSEVANVEDGKQFVAELKQHVTFPDHFQVPEALKNGLTFGSFEASFGQRETVSSGNGGDIASTPAIEFSLESDEPATARSSTGQGNGVDYVQSSPYDVEDTTYSEDNTIPLSESKNVESKQNYGFNLMSTMLGTHHMQFEGSEPRVQETSRIPNLGGNPSALSSQTPTTTLTSSISLSPQSVSLLRPPYPNYFQYSHFYPFWFAMHHQYLGHNGFHQQPSAGNMYLPAAATGVKLPIPQFKPGTNTGNPSPFGLASSSFVSPSLGYAASPAVNTGSSNGNEDLPANPLKESHIYTTGQLSEGSALWNPAAGQDISSLQINPIYNIPPPQGQNVTIPPAQVSHVGFAGMYQPGQTVHSPSTLLQQSQAVAGALEPVGVGLTSGAYQQSQNWNSKF